MLQQSNLYHFVSGKHKEHVAGGMTKIINEKMRCCAFASTKIHRWAVLLKECSDGQNISYQKIYVHLFTYQYQLVKSFEKYVVNRQQVNSL